MEFDTVAHGDDPSDPRARGRMSYRITEIGPDYSVVELTNSGGNARFFKEARWTFRLRPDPLGTLVTCSADFKLRSYYVLLAPLFYAMKGAILTDLKGIKRALEKDL